ncbi:hypothetical protein PHMEG_00027470 [Phytophthora megakarya]|uniref:Uncharacterized protein n=1 Tax=Phytophthora megakarya TaxID=4795 RepID=A0A225V8S9_9STRA|nr:hypothetical protein PHMEG_00027470 [Phytophthora megakarya]
MQIAILQQQMREMEVECDREREAANGIQKFQAITAVPDAVSQIKTESGIANFQQDARSRDVDNVVTKKEKPSDREVEAAKAEALLAAQHQATLRSVNVAKQRRRTAITVPAAMKTEMGTKVMKIPAPNASDDAKMKAKKATSKARTSRKARRGGYPSDLDPSSENEDSDASSDDSNSSFCELLSDMVVLKTIQGGTTTMTIRPFVTASSLDDFDEKLLSQNALVLGNVFRR